MSKHFNPIEEGKNDGDITKRLLRNISVVALSLDNVRGSAQVVSDLFQPSVEVIRYKLHELSDRLILIDPEGQGRRGEDTLWKKGYHDVFTAAKRLRKGDNWDESESAQLKGFLYCGIGHYQQLIFRLQSEYNLHLEGIVDFSQSVLDHGLSKGKSCGGKQEEAPWADALVYRCLLYLGDLARYLKELQSGKDLGLAERYYHQAALLNSKQGRPYNQLGTLSGVQNYSLDAVYYYVRSLCCVEPFQRAEGNLSNALEKIESSVKLEAFVANSISPVAKTISRFLIAVDAWFLHKKMDDLPLICSEFIGGLQQLIRPDKECAGTNVKDANGVLDIVPDPTNHVPMDILLRMLAIMMMCWKKNYSADFSLRTMVMASILAVMEMVVQKIMERCKKCKSDLYKRRGRRRRCRRGSAGSSGSDVSEVGVVGGAESGDSPDESSEEEAEPAHNGYSNGTNGTHEPEVNWIEDEMMSVLYIFCSWLRFNDDDLSTCSNSAKPIFHNLVTILNNISTHFKGETQYERLRESKLPTSEDHRLRGLPGLEKSHEELDWSMRGHPLPRKEAAALRALRLMAYCVQLPTVNFDASTQRFNLMEIQIPASPVVASPTEGKGKLMKNMGQLWLQAEVKDLENRVKKAPNEFSPYLVVDSDALIEHIFLVKQLVGSRQFIVVIPTVVLALLDEFKRESGRARETIRWLESQFQHGNRHLRSQKAQEKSSLGVIKYPKKKDKDAWNFFQMMECCSYLAKQNELRCKGGVKVTFLTGAKEKTIADARGSASDFSPSGLASTIGVTLEHIETFHSKWKLSSKSNG